MTPRTRKVALTAHVTSSVGWLGSVVAYLALAITGLTSPAAPMVQAAYLVMELIGWYVIVPLSLASLLTGLTMSLGTTWGLFRHYWVVVKFVITGVAVMILLQHMRAVSRMAAVATETILSSSDFREQRIQLVVHAGGGLVVLLVATTLSIFKPWGRTRYGRREQEARSSPAESLATTGEGRDMRRVEAPSRSEASRDAGVGAGSGSRKANPWGLYLVLGITGLLVAFVAFHLAGGGLRHH